MATDLATLAAASGDAVAIGIRAALARLTEIVRAVTPREDVRFPFICIEESGVEEELDARANLADMIAVVTVMSVQTNEDIDGKESKKIDITVGDILYGASPSSEFALRSTKDSLGYSLILRHEDSLQGKHIVFVRWFDAEDGSLGHHFHLSPASEKLLGSVRRMAELREEEEKAQNVN